MRKITVCKLKGVVKPGKKDHWYEHTVYNMQPGTAWKLDAYGKHEVVEILPGHAEQAEHVDGCTMHFDGRQMAIFNIDGQEYLQPLEEDARATDDRLGSKRRKRKLRKPRRDAPGVAPQAISWENEGPEPREQPEQLRRAREARASAPRQGKGRRAGPRGGLDVVC